MSTPGMDPRQLKDPAAGVPPQLLPHLHLISKHRYPVLTNPSLETIVGYLLEAPKIMRDVAPVQWQFLDGPHDGTLFLTWQPLDNLSTSFASDGFVWGDAEQTFTSEVRGYTLQMFWQRTGYKPSVETVATHSRKRYRLIPNNQPSGLPNPDHSLWLIHYSKAAARDQLPAASLAVNPVIHQQLQQRRMIQAQGALARKEFMLHDRSNWPIINPSAIGGRQNSGGQLGVNAHRRSQSIVHEVTLEEEEDVSRGDALDFMTPREISRTRYEQHHEWMEEILESPYMTNQIIPPELGLGRKGALESLTNGFFTTPTSTSTESSTNGKVGKMAPEKADEFTKRANQHLADMQAELEKMKQKHYRRMEKLKRTTELNSAERKLRNANADSTDQIIQEVETLTGKKVDRIPYVDCVEKGGLQIIHNVTANGTGQNGVAKSQILTANEANIPPDGIKTGPQSNDTTHSSLEQQIPSNPQLSSSGEQVNSSAQLQAVQEPQDTSAGGAVDRLASAEDEVEKDDAELQSLGDDGADVEMEGLDTDFAVGDDEITEPSDWVMVDDQKIELDNVHDPNTADDGEQQDLGTPGDYEALETNSNEVSRPLIGQQAPQQQLAQQQEVTGSTPLDTDDFDMGGEFDTAGDALADYGAGDDLMDETAFGDAFHPPDENDIS